MTQKRFRTTTLALLVLTGACAREEAPPPTAAAPEPEKPTVEAAADQRLRAMSSTLAAAQSLSFSTSERHERVSAAGVKTPREFTRDAVIVRPDKLWTARSEDGKTAKAIYDGSTLTLQGDAQKVWSQVEMPPTLDEALDYVAEVYRFPMPIADLLYSDPYGSFVADDTAARLAGKESISGMNCEKVTVETPIVTADLWVEEGERALPCKLDILYKELEQTPRSTIVFSNWNLAPTVDAKIFQFSAPEGYRKIRMVAVLSPEEERLVREAAKQAAPPGGGPAGQTN